MGLFNYNCFYTDKLSDRQTTLLSLSCSQTDDFSGQMNRLWYNSIKPIFACTCNGILLGKKRHEKGGSMGSMVEWFRALGLKSGGPWFKSSTLLLSGFVLGCPEFNSSTVLCKLPTGQPSTSWDS